MRRRRHLLLPGDLLPELGGLLPDGLHSPPALSNAAADGVGEEVGRRSRGEI
jgi:hypothetical protein